jgi:hypothetical protein
VWAGEWGSNPGERDGEWGTNSGERAGERGTNTDSEEMLEEKGGEVGRGGGVEHMSKGKGVGDDEEKKEEKVRKKESARDRMRQFNELHAMRNEEKFQRQFERAIIRGIIGNIP